MVGACGENGLRKGSSEGTTLVHLEADGAEKERPKKKWKEELNCYMIARGLQRLDAQNCERWRLRCKSWLTPSCMAPEIEGSTFLAQNDGDDVTKSYSFCEF